MLSDEQIQRVGQTIHTRGYLEQGPDGAWRVVEPAGARPAMSLAELRRLHDAARIRFLVLLAVNVARSLSQVPV